MTRSEWKRLRWWLVRFLAAETALVAIFAWCCSAMISCEEPEPLVVVREMPVEVTVAPEVQEVPDDPGEAAVALARTVWGEARGCSATEQAAVAWCVLNRVDSSEFPDDVLSVVSQEGQFDGYDPSYPVEEHILALCEDVLARWELEKLGVGSVGRVLPADYLFLEGDGKHNHFRREYVGDGTTWDWSLESPYGEG